MNEITSEFIGVKPRKSRRRRQSVSPPTPAALNLVAASYENFTAILSFDRPIDLSAFDPTAIFVNDADRSMRMQGGAEYSLSDPNTIAMAMGEIGDYEGSETVLQANAANGIVAVDDGGVWSGTEGTGLPFP